jgi:ribosomal protein S25
MKPAVRPYAGKVLVDVAASLLADLERAWRWADELDELTDALEGELAAVRLQRAKLEREQQETAKRMETLERELAQARANLARRRAATSLLLPAQKITVESGIQREILRLLAIEGLGRVWRIVERVVAAGLTGTPNTARNAVNRLAERGLLADYEQHGKPVTWAYKAGGTRRLVQLTPTGRQWCQAAFGQEPVESEIAVAARRHKSVSHGIAVLETAYHLAAAGYAAETEPGAILAAEDEPWRARAEPDLAFTLRGEVWPTEVQREVSPRVVAKWAKSLELRGRLALVLYHEEARRKQQMILFEARYKLPTGKILLTSIETMEAGGWAWEELTTPR